MDDYREDQNEDQQNRELNEALNKTQQAADIAKKGRSVAKKAKPHKKGARPPGTPGGAPAEAGIGEAGVGELGAGELGAAGGAEVAGGIAAGGAEVGVEVAGGAAAGEAAGAIGGGIAAGGWVVVVIILIILLIIVIIMILTGAGGQTACSGGITSTSQVASTVNPAVLTIDGCPDNVVYIWGEDESTKLGGTFSPEGLPSTTYTPPFVGQDTPVTIDVMVCAQNAATNCTTYTTTLTVQSSTCAIYNGTCKSPTDAAKICNEANGLKIVQAVCPTQGEVCCKATALSVHFFCQYYRPGRTDCTVKNSGSTCNNNGCNGITNCDIVHTGCSPTSIAMILTSFGDSGKDPRSVALANSSLLSLPRSQVPGNGCTCGGSFVWNFRTYINNLGHRFVKVNLANESRNTFNTALARSYLAQGCLLLAANNMTYSNGGKTHCSSGGPGGHATVISNVDSNGIITDYDPTCCTNDTNYNQRHFAATDRGAVANWWYVYPVCPK